MRISVTGIQYLTSIAKICVPLVGEKILILFSDRGNILVAPPVNTAVPTAGHQIDQILLPASLHHANNAPVPKYPLA